MPIRFISLPVAGFDATVNPNGTWENIAGSVQVTNQAFRNAGIQFSVAGVDRFVPPALPFVSAIVQNSRWGLPDEPQFIERYCNQGNVTWNAIRADLATIFPIIDTPGAGTLPAGTTERTTQQWLNYAAARWSPREEIVAYIPACGGLYGTYPHEGRNISAHRDSLNDWWKFAHEMGHVWGLTHADGEGDPDGTAAATLSCFPSGATACNWTTGTGFGDMADFWDMVYRPGTSASSPHLTFNNRAEAVAAGIGNLRWIVDGKPDTNPSHNCSVSHTNISTFGRMVCIVPGIGNYAELWDTDDPATAAKLRGYMWPVSGGHHGRAMMTYLLEQLPNEKEVHGGFSDSQANLIRLNLRYDQSYSPNDPVGGLLVTAGISAGRPFLGRAVARRPRDLIDFDDDGLRDLAMWSPPIPPNALGTFRVLGSRGYFASQSTQLFGELGDVPVVADYNGDGITDYAVYHDAGAANGDGRTWRWCLSTRGAPIVPTPPAGTPQYAPPTHSCATPGTYTYGIRGDVPIPGTRLFPGSSYELSVYRPSSGFFFTFSSSAGHKPLDLVLSATKRGQTPYISAFDTHSGSDVAFYNPQTAKFSLWLSSTAWTTRIDRNFCPSGPPCSYIPGSSGTSAARGGAVPVWGLATQKLVGSGLIALPTDALGLWDPSNGTWNVMWNPTASSAMETHQWGYQTDGLVAGPVGLKASDLPITAGTRSDLVVFRSESTSGPGTFYRCAFSPGSYNCPAPATPQIVGFGQKRWETFVAADMIGDGKPELCAFDPQLQVVRCLTSDTNYAGFWVITAPFTNPVSPYAIVGGQLL